MVHSHGAPTGAAAAFMIRPTTAPSASTSKSSSFHSPDVREADARLRISIGAQFHGSMSLMCVGEPLNSLRCRYQPATIHAIRGKAEGTHAAKVINSQDIGEEAYPERHHAYGGPN